ncbi:MAG: flippase [Acidobacteriaceae bacterium]
MIGSSTTKNQTRRKLLGNIFSLYALLGLNYLIPIAVLPYLIRVLGVEYYGLIAFAQALAQYFTILTNYGFDFSATKRLAIIRADKTGVSRMFWTVLLTKMLLMFAGMLVLTAIIRNVPRFHPEMRVYFIAYIAVIGNALFPAWFFQGMEKMKFISVINGVSRLTAAASLFLFVHARADFVTALIILSSGTLLSGIAGLYVAIAKFSVQLYMPSIMDIACLLKDGWHMFVSTASISLYTNTNVLLVGLLAGNVEAGYFSVAEKLVRAMTGLISPVSQAIFPHLSALVSVSRALALQFIRKSLLMIGLPSLLASLALLFFAHPIAQLVFGHNVASIVPIIRWIAMLPFIIAISNVLGIQTMVTFGMDKQFSRILIMSGIVNVLLAIPLIKLYRAQGASMSLLITEVLVTTSMWIVLQRNGIDIMGAKKVLA